MLSQNTIYIIGAGAIGKALAVILTRKGVKVIILRGSIDNQANYEEKICVELSDQRMIEAEVLVSTLSHFPGLDGIVVLANKSYGNLHLSKALVDKIHQSPLVVLQNGLHVEEPFIHKGYPQIYRCVLYTTCQFISQNTVRLKPVAASPVGVIKGTLENLEWIVREFDSPDFAFRSENNIQPIIWTKVIINSVFNSLCPLLETDNGIFYRNEKVLDLARRIIAECIAVAKVQGILLDADKVTDSLLQISKFSDGQLISTYQDIQQKRSTEIETLNFAIAKVANESGMGHVAGATNLLGELIYLKSEIHRGN
jgi:2-dehydropantoate 2-reductase